MLGILLSFFVSGAKSVTDIFFKLASGKVDDDKVIVFFQRIIEASLAFLIFLSSYLFLNFIFTNSKNIFTFDFLCILLIGTFLGATAIYFNIKAFRNADASLISPISQLTPAFLLFTSPLMVGDKVSFYGFTGVLLVVAGSYFLGMKNEHTTFLEPIKSLYKNTGVRYALLASFIYAITSNIDKIAVTKTNPIVWTFTTGYLTAIFMLFMIRKNKSLSQVDKSNVLYLLVPGFTGGIGSIVQLYAITLLPVPYVISIKRTASLFTVLYGVFVLKETEKRNKIIGAIFMVLGTLLILILG